MACKCRLSCDFIKGESYEDVGNKPNNAFVEYCPVEFGLISVKFLYCRSTD
jgi:hypothetical protein